MIEQKKWFDKKFTFDIKPENFSEIIERLRGTPARIKERTKNLTREQLKIKNNNQWSIQENIGHLLDLEPIWAGRLDDLLSGRRLTEMRSADLSNTKTHQANHNNNEPTNLLRGFRKARFEFVDKLETLNEKEIEISLLHPRLQKQMRVIDLAFFVAEHDDHHLVMITKIINTCCGN
ncbi:MAG: DinB family protein [Ignavibacteria bacterium]|jgi:hypothetical protein